MISRASGLTIKGWLFYCLTVLIITLFSPAVDAARKVESKRECATCHIMWLDEFKQKNITTLIPYDPQPITDTGKQDVSSTERMCFSCHDGFVLDSRFMWQEQSHGHPVGISPPEDMKIPTVKGKTIFPLNEDGNIYCGTCHTAHGVDWGSKESPIFMRIKNVESSLCLACHLEKSTGINEGNHPIFEKPAQLPDDLIAGGAKFAADGSITCESCHRPHGGEQQPMLIKSNGKAALCTSCHQDKSGLVDSSHDMTNISSKIKADIDKQNGPCAGCHTLHDGKKPSLLLKKLSSDEGGNAAASCVSCHNEEGVAKKKLTGIHSHPVNITLDKLEIQIDKQGWSSKHNWELPLDAKKRISCLTCHDPHNSTEGDGNSSFLRIAQGQDSKLCINCHLDKRAIKYSTHNIESKENNKDTCASCHSVHNAKGITLNNVGSLEDGQGKTAMENWCKSCHQKGQIASDKLIPEHGHPIAVQPKQMTENSGLPLFDKSGKRTAQNGQVDCATCHNPHQWASEVSRQEKTITKAKDGDASNSYLRLAANKDSALCVSCHQDNGLVIGTDHDMQVTANDTTNTQGQTVEQSGVCGQCHAVHQPVLTNNLWARKTGQGQDLIEQQCLGCHNKKGSAKAKVPQQLQHPADVMVWSAETRQLDKHHSIPVIPVYNKDGEDMHAGFISCTSCHNPHQWDPRKKAPGPGENLEGDVLTSFLRNKSSEYIVCADCHGNDALFRYKFYHGDSSREVPPDLPK